MIRIVNMSGKFYGIEVDMNDEEIENIEQFTNEGTPVILVNDLSDLGIFDIDEDDITMVEPE